MIDSRAGRWMLAFPIWLAISSFSLAKTPRFDWVRPAELGLLTSESRHGNGIGLAAIDFDDDGDVDLFVTGDRGVRHHLFQNRGDGTFDDVAGTLEIAELTGARNALWLDANGDGRLDLLIGDDCFREQSCAVRHLIRLYIQSPDGVFQESGEAFGLAPVRARPDQHRAGFAAGDLNGDGWLDWISGFWLGTVSLYINREGERFDEVTALSGIDSEERGYWQFLIHDFNDDGLADIFATVDFGSNLLWINQGTDAAGVPAFTEHAAISGLDNAMNDMGAAIADFDDDGDPDLYVSNIFIPPDAHNVLAQNHSDCSQLRFDERSRGFGVDDGGWGWGVTWLDADNDGIQELAETSGWRLYGWEDSIRLFSRISSQSLNFRNVAFEAGFRDRHWGSALIKADFDGDGLLDLAQSQPPSASNRFAGGSIGIYRNISVKPGNFLVVRPRIVGPNSRAIGARIVIETDLGFQMRWIHAGTSFMGQEPAQAHFGLGALEKVNRVHIVWPDGQISRFVDILANQVLNVRFRQDPGALRLRGRAPGELAPTRYSEGNRRTLLEISRGAWQMPGLFCQDQ